ncbi:histidine kinase [Streptomyces sp. NPDC007162]|uniref:histidine kinase n=1 Tax=Streptomyces sp. NPDC007162 TaxID=3156917 RepID=UPI0034015B2C
MAVAISVATAQLVAWAVVFWQGRRLEFATRPEVVSPMAVAGLMTFALLGLLTRLAHAYAVALRKERDRQAHLAVAQERSRVSREMHDILRRTLAVIVGLADGAAALAATQPERGARTLTSSCSTPTPCSSSPDSGCGSARRKSPAPTALPGSCPRGRP